jgi:hypothetical protein
MSDPLFEGEHISFSKERMREILDDLQLRHEVVSEEERNRRASRRSYHHFPPRGEDFDATSDKVYTRDPHYDYGSSGGYDDFIGFYRGGMFHPPTGERLSDVSERMRRFLIDQGLASDNLSNKYPDAIEVESWEVPPEMLPELDA